ncbi:hypothetical protein GCM10010112_59930 [Actinoplanes lobatus]|uniref:DUF1819 domain-containing protein n=1 Tax=Actinoplanes lobatus TaxID=113568 RepID=A0A7W7HQU1_9ACTN|nr:DUF1819 family protein [Actinoplanes lobatus]MBB4755023.1 hypothetical protein [Actinoplanes lobatus]GGN82483.1 hypothetical protein GCM10010112_59930 [Actinoplanes lobatus]GIE40659.1 hypothetical protein Alo02nite_35570 [Actinoplanes lobatus]
MAGDTDAGARYRLSFTSGALLAREAAVVAPVFLAERDWARVRARIESQNLLQARTVTSGQRLAREVVQRLSVLSGGEIEALAGATATERGHLLWLAACRRYRLIGDFAEEVLRERFLLRVPALTHDDFDGFVRGKAVWHDELAGLTTSTARKLRANLFRMLHEAGFLTESGGLAGAVLSPRTVGVLRPGEVRFFPTISEVPGA